MQKTRVLLYGANGYTGRLTAELAASRRLDLVLAGRNREALASMGARLNLPIRVVGLHEARALSNALADIACVAHMAGPFAETSAPMLDACVATRTNYVDITGEIEVFEAAWSREAEIRRAGITVVPGAGFDVVPSDCLAVYVAGKLERPTSLVLAMRGLESASQGTIRTAVRQISEPVLCRRRGAIVALGDRSARWIDFGSGREPCLPVSWGDVATAFHSTGIGDITVYFRRSTFLRVGNAFGGLFRPFLRSEIGQRALAAIVRRFPAGPSEGERRARRTTIWAEAADDSGRSFNATVTTPDPYDFTAQSALEIALRVTALPAPLGLVSPAQGFGADFVLALPGCSRTDLATVRLPCPR